MARPSRSTPRYGNLRFLPILIVAVQICACLAGAREAPVSIEDKTMAAEAAAAEAVPAATPVPWTPVPGLPDLPDTNAPLQSVQADAAAAVAALRNVITYNGTKKIPYTSKSGPIWRRGVSPPVAEFQANTIPSQQPPVPIPVPPGVVVEQYEVLSEERVTWVNGTKVVERMWVPVTVGRPVGSTANNTKKAFRGPLAAASAASQSQKTYPALFILHSTSGDRARSLQRVIQAAQRGYVALAPDARYFGTRGVLWESNCTVWQEKMAYINNKTANAHSVTGNGASCPTPANSTEGDLPLYNDKITAAYVNKGASERPYLIDNLWDLQRVLDWLFYVGTDEKFEVQPQEQQQQGAAAVVGAAFALSDKAMRRDVFGENRKLFNVDPARVGTTGISLGGLHSSLLGVVEQKRISVLAPAIGVPTFAWGAGHGDEWQPRAFSIPGVFIYAANQAGLTAPTAEIYVNVFNIIDPDIFGPWDASRSLAALAPRPLLIANGRLDGRNPLGGVEQAVTRAQKIYDAQNKSNQLEYFLDPNAFHEYTPLMEAQVNAWLDKWLMP